MVVEGSKERGAKTSKGTDKGEENQEELDKDHKAEVTQNQKGGEPK